jgi:hypothetical protein
MQLRGILQASRTAGGDGGLDVPMKEAVLEHLRTTGSMRYTEAKMHELMEIITDSVVALERGTGVSNWVVRLLVQRLKV